VAFSDEEDSSSDRDLFLLDTIGIGVVEEEEGVL